MSEASKILIAGAVDKVMEIVESSEEFSDALIEALRQSRRLPALKVDWRGQEWLARIPGMTTTEHRKHSTTTKLRYREVVCLEELISFVQGGSSKDLEVIKSYVDTAVGLVKIRCVELLRLHDIEIEAKPASQIERALLSGSDLPEGLHGYPEGILWQGRWWWMHKVSWETKLCVWYLTVGGKKFKLAFSDAARVVKEIGPGFRFTVSGSDGIMKLSGA